MAAPAIVPRWEWRVFGSDFPARTRAAERVQESDELYLLSAGSDASVKVRDGLMDVKHRLDVGHGGLEQWAPVLKAPFPLGADDVRFVLTTLRVEGVALDRASYTVDELVEEIAGPGGGVHAVAVHKRRERLTIGGCMAERTELRTGEGSVATLAVEAEDPARVAAVVRELGLQSRPVVSMARGLKALVGVGTRTYAVIDVGTNSVKFHVGARDAAGAWRSLVDRAEVTRLGEGLDRSGRLDPEPMRRTVEAIAAMVDEAGRHGVEEVAAVGTAGLRIAANATELIDAVEARCGVRIEVISGEEEARLAYRATVDALGLPPGPVVVFDTGGGSSQFTFGADGQVTARFSVDVGAARVTERFGLDGPVGSETVSAALDAIAGDLARVADLPRPDVVVGMGGAVTNLVAVQHALATYDPDVVQGARLPREEIDRQIELYRTRTADERREIAGLQPKRAEVILAGACIVRTVVGLFGAEAVTVSDRGLRHGLLVERFRL